MVLNVELMHVANELLVLRASKYLLYYVLTFQVNNAYLYIPLM